MYRFWDTVIGPALELSGTRTIVEIGIGEGKNTRNLLQFCKEHGGFLHAIDPNPGCSIEEWEKEYRQICTFHRKKSLEVLPLLPPCDAILIDGDHNWYTVYHELLLLQKNAGQSSSFPIVFLHDTGWPYARRDLYYEPSDIPPAYCHPHAKSGIHIHSKPGEINPDHNNALAEGGERNGVLTAIEDFLKHTGQGIRHIALPGFHGLSILVSEHALESNSTLRTFCTSIPIESNIITHIESLELDRIEEMQTRGYFENQWKEAHARYEEWKTRWQETHKKWEEVDSQRKETEAHLEHAKHALQSAQTILEEESQKLSRTQTTLDRVLRSRSWKYTYPMRWAEHRVRSLFRENKKVIPRAEVMSAHTFTPENIPAEDYRKWQQHHWLSPERMAKSVLAVTCLSRTPTISIIVTMYNSSEIFLRKALNSVAEQTYTHWELILVDDGSFSPLPEKIAQEFAALYPHKVVFRRLPVRGGISTATNAGAALAKGEYLAFLDHDDLLELDALEKIASFIQNSPVPPDALYTDDDLIDEEDWRYAPAFKPDWSPELLLSFCYVGHWKIVRRTLFLEMQGYRSPFDGAQDYDFFLRLSEKTDRIAHVPKILYHWRNVPQSASKNPVSLERGRKAVDEALQRRSGCASAQYIEDAEDAGLGIYRVAFTPSTTTPVTIIIPTKGKGKLLQRCIQSIRQTTPSIPFTFLIVDNGISDTATLKFLQEESLNVINIDTPQFNFSRLINAAVNQAPTELLLFLNDDTEVITPTWLEEMTGVLRMDTRIGAVGAKLLYPDHSIQHGGVSLLETTAANTNKYLHGNAWGYRYSNRVLRNCAAVTAACMLTRKSCFQEVEGFDEQYFPVGYNDVDYCLKLREKGYRTVWTPHAVLLHHESATRPKYSPDDRSHLALQEKWPALLRNDPYMNPHFSRKTEQFVLMTHT